MISKLVRYSIDYRWLVFLVTALVALGGWYSFTNLPIDAVPDVLRASSRWARNINLLVYHTT